MFIKQVSIFVENKHGKVSEIIDLLGKNDIDINALSIADTIDYGVLRLVVNKPNTACKILKENNYVVKVNDVIGISIDNKPGGLSKALNLLKEKNVDIQYLYAFLGGNKNSASVMLKVENLDEALDIFTKNDIELLNAKDIQIE